jgi:hypothetical protein
MPTVEANIQSTLGALVSGRCYPLVNTSATITAPYITFQVISQSALTVTATEQKKMRVQVDLFATTYGAARTLLASVEAAMEAATTFESSLIMSFDGYEEVSKEYRVTLDYYVWPQ